MNTKTRDFVPAYRLVPGLHTFRGGKILAISGPHRTYPGKAIRVEYLDPSGFGDPRWAFEYVPALMQVWQ